MAQLSVVLGDYPHGQALLAGEVPVPGRQLRPEIGGDPIPYGMAANEASIRALVKLSREQGLLDADSPGEPAALFAAGDYPDA
jgi:4,5-dihydroxyphthalate decarboxylase